MEIKPEPIRTTATSDTLEILDDTTDTETIDSLTDTDAIAENLSAKPKQKKMFIVYLQYLVYFLFWATCYAIAIQLKFGTVYFLFSALFGVYFNTRTGPKPANEISAYSVFNKDCHSIDGTLKAEQFEREIRYGPVSVR